MNIVIFIASSLLLKIDSINRLAITQLHQFNFCVQHKVFKMKGILLIYSYKKTVKLKNEINYNILYFFYLRLQTNLKIETVNSISDIIICSISSGL